MKHLQALGLFLSSTGLLGTYTTTFPASENPVAEHSKWINAGNTGGGGLWGNVRTASGMAFGASQPTRFGDPTAVLAGEWGADQTAEGVVHVSPVPTRCCREVELRLRTTITPDRITGYEAYCSVVPTKPYCNIARWNGPNGSYWNIAEVSGVYAADGDLLLATVTGSNPTTITLYKNGTQVAQAIDTGGPGGGFGASGPWTSGSPGIGFYLVGDDDWKSFGFSSFTASDTISPAIQTILRQKVHEMHHPGALERIYFNSANLRLRAVIFLLGTTIVGLLLAVAGSRYLR